MDIKSKEKKNCLIVLKRKSNYSNSLVRNFSNFYNVFIFLVHDRLNKNSKSIISEINSIIVDQNIELALFEGDYISLINYNFIKSVDCQIKCLITLDDDDCHSFNLITGKDCDLVLTTCPTSVQKYLKNGINSHLFTLESSAEVFKDYKKGKNIDVLFFGRKSKYREEYIDFIKSRNITVKIVGWDGPDKVSDTELAEIISRSKIVINFSEASNKYKKYNPRTSNKNQNQLKGRIWQAGLCRAACISDNFISREIIFNDSQLAIFNNKEECVSLINKLLNNDKLLKGYTENLHKIVLEKYETKKNLTEINNYIYKMEKNKNTEKNIPFWDSRFVNKKRIGIYFRNKSLKGFMSEYIQIVSIHKKKISLLYILNFLEATIYMLTYLLKFPFINLKK